MMREAVFGLVSTQSPRNVTARAGKQLAQCRMLMPVRPRQAAIDHPHRQEL